MYRTGVFGRTQITSSMK